MGGVVGLRIALRIALLAAFRHGWQAGAWHVSDATGGGRAAQRAAADREKRRADSNAYVDSALAEEAAPDAIQECLDALSYLVDVYDYQSPDQQSLGQTQGWQRARAALAAVV